MAVRLLAFEELILTQKRDERSFKILGGFFFLDLDPTRKGWKDGDEGLLSDNLLGSVLAKKNS